MIPVVERVAPKLARRGEIVGRHPGYRERLPVPIQPEYRAVLPRVRAVERDEDRHVANDPDAAGRRVSPQPLPLAEEKVLIEGVAVGVAPHRLRKGCVQLGGPASEFLGPRRPRPPAEVGLERHEVGEGLQPDGVLPAESGHRPEALQVVSVRCGEAVVCPRKHPPEFLVQAAVVDARVRQFPEGRHLVCRQKAGAHELAQVDEIRVAGVAREGLVGRVAITRRADGADLPVAHPRASKEVHEPPGSRPEVADAVAAGQGGYMGQHRGAAGGEPGGRGGAH